MQSAFSRMAELLLAVLFLGVHLGLRALFLLGHGPGRLGRLIDDLFKMHGVFTEETAFARRCGRAGCPLSLITLTMLPSSLTTSTPQPQSRPWQECFASKTHLAIASATPPTMPTFTGMLSGERARSFRTTIWNIAEAARALDLLHDGLHFVFVHCMCSFPNSPVFTF